MLIGVYEKLAARFTGKRHQMLPLGQPYSVKQTHCHRSSHYRSTLLVRVSRQKRVQVPSSGIILTLSLVLRAHQSLRPYHPVRQLHRLYHRLHHPAALRVQAPRLAPAKAHLPAKARVPALHALKAPVRQYRHRSLRVVACLRVQVLAHP